LRFAVVEAYGEGAERLIDAVQPALVAQLSSITPRPSHLGSIWYALGFATLALPLATALLARPEVQAALRKIRGG
jgi:uncharacterized membrane protein (GlpM family)